MKTHAELFEAMGKLMTGVLDGTVTVEQAKAGSQVGHAMVELLKVEASIVNGSEGLIRPQLIEVDGNKPSPERVARLQRLDRA